MSNESNAEWSDFLAKELIFKMRNSLNFRESKRERERIWNFFIECVETILNLQVLHSLQEEFHTFLPLCGTESVPVVAKRLSSSSFCAQTTRWFMRPVFMAKIESANLNRNLVARIPSIHNRLSVNFCNRAAEWMMVDDFGGGNLWKSNGVSRMTSIIEVLKWKFYLRITFWNSNSRHWYTFC